MFYVIPQIPFLAYSVYFGGFLVQFLVEKMGMMGSVPPPFGEPSSTSINFYVDHDLSTLFINTSVIVEA